MSGRICPHVSAQGSTSAGSRRGNLAGTLMPVSGVLLSPARARREVRVTVPDPARASYEEMVGPRPGVGRPGGWSLERPEPPGVAVEVDDPHLVVGVVLDDQVVLVVERHLARRPQRQLDDRVRGRL